MWMLTIRGQLASSLEQHALYMGAQHAGSTLCPHVSTTKDQACCGLANASAYVGG